jgi:mannan endo-1,4-beta-mannosidase
MKKLWIMMVLFVILISSSSLFLVNAVPAGFVSPSGTKFVKDGAPFYYAGTNCYYPNYAPNVMIDGSMSDAAAMKLRVFRLWAFLDCGTKTGDLTFTNNADGLGQKNNCYIQYWDPVTRAPAYNTGDNGLKKLDYIIYKASQNGVKVWLPFTNNWIDFGGMKQYCLWLGLSNKDDFYTNPTIKQYYKNYISMLLNRTNTYTGIKYKDDPTIFAWELANEPRCESDTTGNTLVNWATEMSQYVKSIDPNHMVDVGDEGFYNIPYAQGEDRSYCSHGSSGVDFIRLLKIPTIDFGSYHLYPDSWNTTADWGTTWIKNHIKDGIQIGKPVVLGEYGMKSNKDSIYQTWHNAVLAMNGAGANFWMLAGVKDDGTMYPDYDGFTVYYPSATATVITNFANSMNAKTTAGACEPAGFSQLSPPDEFNGTPTKPTFTWEPSIGATSYTLQLSQDPNFNTVTLSQTGITGTSYTLTTALTPYASYWFRVIAVNAQGSTYSRNSRTKFYVGNSTATSTPTPTIRTATPTPTRRVTATPTQRVTVTPTQRVTPTVTRRGTATPTPTRGSATATPTRPATPTPTIGGGGYVVTYTIQNDWGSGATINVTIKNNTTVAVNGWTLAWTFPGNQVINSLWCGVYTQSGAAVSVRDNGNANIPASGGTVIFGFNINYSGTNAKPTSCTLNGTACQIQ